MLYLVINELTAITQVTILILENNMATNTTIDFEDKNQFDAIAEQWWNPSGSLKSLHQFTPIRIEYIKNSIKRHHFGEWGKLRPLSNLQILDIGCGGGLLAEPMSKLGGIVTGIDSYLSTIEIARQHAEASKLAPLGYFEIVNNILIGYYFFGDFPNKWLWLGLFFIVSSGIYISIREVRKLN